MNKFIIILSCFFSAKNPIHQWLSENGATTAPSYPVEYFYTNRNLAIEDTLYLPIEQKCLLRLSVDRYIDKLQRIDNQKYLQTTHTLYSNSTLQEKGNNQLIKDFCYVPTCYKKIVPSLVTIYDVDSIEQIRYDMVREQMIDLIYLIMDIEYDSHEWKTMYKTTFGKEIANYMSLIETYLWQKIESEVTLVEANRAFISDECFIHILPSKK